MKTNNQARATKTLTILFAATVSISSGQSVTPSHASLVTAQPATARALPPYVVYRHFMGWVNQLDKAATASGTTDPYKFAEPFSRANLQHQHLDILRAEAQKLDAELEQHKAKAQKVIAQYRKDATAALAKGQPLPPGPKRHPRLNREHTAILVHHYATLRASLGPDVSNQLDSYLNYEFAPHISLKGVAAVPGTPVAH